MSLHPHITSQLGRERQRQMLADASRRQIRRQLRRPQRHHGARTANPVGTIIRRVTTAIAGAGRHPAALARSSVQSGAASAPEGRS
jgi:hypothetical protein